MTYAPAYAGQAVGGHTKPLTKADTDLRLENVVNRLKRHCKIGKVTPRPVAIGSKVFKDILGATLFNRREMPEMCRMCIGKVCGNAACPMRPVVT